MANYKLYSDAEVLSPESYNIELPVIDGKFWTAVGDFVSLSLGYYTTTMELTPPVFVCLFVS